MKNIDVLIVGAGPAGLTLACDLKRRGIACRIIEKLSSPLVGSKGKGIQPRSLELLDDLGLTDGVLANSGLYPVMQIYKGSTPVATHSLYPILEPTPETPFPNILMQPQWKTEDLLRDRLAELGGTVEFDTAFESLEQNEDRVIATLRKGTEVEQVTSRYLIGTDGGRGMVRKAIGVSLDGENPALDGILIADVRVDGLDRSLWHVWSTASGRKVTLCPLPASDAFQYAAMVDEKDQPELTLEELQALLDEGTGGKSHVLRDISWISLFRPNVRMASNFRKGRVFLAGDAAHIHTPAGAQGMNTSVQDAYNLGWKIGAVIDGADPALLDTYEEERQPIAAAVLKRSDELYNNALSEEELAREPDESQLSVNYRRSSLCGPSNPTTRLQPGDRMPGADLRDGTGAKVTLFDLFRGPHGSTLYIDRPLGSPQSGSRAFSITTSASKDGRGDAPGYTTVSESLNDLTGRIVSIRPDGYILSITEQA